MVDRRQILVVAWASYRLARPAIFAAGDEGDKRRFLRPFFAKMLTRAWAEAKRAEATKTAETIAAELDVRLQAKRAATIAAMAPADRSARLSHIADEIHMLDYAPLGVRLAGRRAALETELHLLATHQSAGGHYGIAQS